MSFDPYYNLRESYRPRPSNQRQDDPYGPEPFNMRMSYENQDRHMIHQDLEENTLSSPYTVNSHSKHQKRVRGRKETWRNKKHELPHVRFLRNCARIAQSQGQDEASQESAMAFHSVSDMVSSKDDNGEFENEKYHHVDEEDEDYPTNDELLEMSYKNLEMTLTDGNEFSLLLYPLDDVDDLVDDVCQALFGPDGADDAEDIQGTENKATKMHLLTAVRKEMLALQRQEIFRLRKKLKENDKSQLEEDYRQSQARRKVLKTKIKNQQQRITSLIADVAMLCARLDKLDPTWRKTNEVHAAKISTEELCRRGRVKPTVNMINVPSSRSSTDTRQNETPRLEQNQPGYSSLEKPIFQEPIASPMQVEALAEKIPTTTRISTLAQRDREFSTQTDTTKKSKGHRFPAVDESSVPMEMRFETATRKSEGAPQWSKFAADSRRGERDFQFMSSSDGEDDSTSEGNQQTRNRRVSYTYRR